MADEDRDFPGVGDDAFGATDPDMEMKLGAELEFRGDVLEADLAAAQQEVEEWRDKAARAQAEFENSRKRLEARHSDALLRASERVVFELLPVVDDLERAIDHVMAENPESAEGIIAVQRKLLGVMDKEGVGQIDPLGQPFDPAKHNAVQMQDSDEVPDHTVVAVFQKGYEMHGRVLRPAMVVVSTGGPEAGK
ncbi:MAG TPA: nucleotide exchange factor GrpE [Coriobacteriia bacterium]|nr:nucleotide exchange factor GrpE [Coriobacteriia bacterium]